MAPDVHPCGQAKLEPDDRPCAPPTLGLAPCVRPDADPKDRADLKTAAAPPPARVIAAEARVPRISPASARKKEEEGAANPVRMKKHLWICRI